MNGSKIVADGDRWNWHGMAQSSRWEAKDRTG